MTDKNKSCMHRRMTERCPICNPHTEEYAMPTVAAKKMTRAEAQAALQVYMNQEIEARTISLIETLVQKLVDFPTEAIEVRHRSYISGFERTLMLQQVKELELGGLAGPPWLDRFQKLVDEIRDEFDLRVKEVATPLGSGDDEDVDPSFPTGI